MAWNSCKSMSGSRQALTCTGARGTSGTSPFSFLRDHVDKKQQKEIRFFGRIVDINTGLFCYATCILKLADFLSAPFVPLLMLQWELIKNLNYHIIRGMRADTCCITKKSCINVNYPTKENLSLYGYFLSSAPFFQLIPNRLLQLSIKLLGRVCEIKI